MTSLAQAKALDRDDPLKDLRARFDLPEGVIYLDGNSLGALPKAVAARVAATIQEEWGRDLIKSWNTAGWYHLPRRVGDKIARVIGAGPGTVVVTDSTSVNLFKVLSAALTMNRGRRVIVSERENFPTDLYVAEGVIKQMGRDHALCLVDSADALPAALDEDVAVLMLTQVNYRSGYLHDMATLTRQAQEKGILTIWDLAHSAGALPVDLAGSGADFAVGCGYKYLNGGPGAPAFLYVGPDRQEDFTQPLSGWFSHKAPFAFESRFAEADGIARALCGTPPVLSLVALDTAMDLWNDVSLDDVRAKSMALTSFFVDCVESLCDGHGLQLASPRDPERRGSQVSFASRDDGYAIMQALIARGVIGDFRAPDILRFGLTPLYTGFADAWRAAESIRDILETGAWKDPAFGQRAAVT